MEGFYTKWHLDIGFPHLHSHLLRLYPDLTTLPTVEEALEYHLRWDAYVKRLRETPSAKRNKMTDSDLQIEKEWFSQRDLAWSPPPHLCSWQTPVPARYFDDASGIGDRCQWSLLHHHNTDLVPHEQPCLQQDAGDCRAMQHLTSADARACISLCRPHACHTQKRREGKQGSGKTIATVPFQSGEIAMRPLTPHEDEARGMLSGIVASQDVLKNLFALKADEPAALRLVLPWLQNHNPWFGAYKSSLQEVTSAWSFVQELAAQGRIVAAGPAAARTSTGTPLSDTLGNDGIAVFMPVSDLSACTGSYRHLRAAADRVMQAELRESLPPAWQSAVESDLCDKDGKPIWKLPKAFRFNQSFTSVAVRDRNFDAKVFVQQHPYGTGSLNSTCDCVASRFDFYQHRLFSLDQVFADTADPEWTFMMREREIKTRLMTDYLGRLDSGAKQAAHGKATDNEDVYSIERFSHRIGTFIDDSPQALGQRRADWLELAAPENLGAPNAMTTIVANAKTSTIRAHAERGPLAAPNPEDTVLHLFSNAQPFPLLTNLTAQGIDYLRRKREFFCYAYQQNFDALRGRVLDYLSRREKRINIGCPCKHQFVVYSFQ